MCTNKYHLFFFTRFWKKSVPFLENGWFRTPKNWQLCPSPTSKKHSLFACFLGLDCLQLLHASVPSAQAEAPLGLWKHKTYHIHFNMPELNIKCTVKSVQLPLSCCCLLWLLQMDSVGFGAKLYIQVKRGLSVVGHYSTHMNLQYNGKL